MTTALRTRPFLLVAGALAMTTVSAAVRADVGITLLPVQPDWISLGVDGVSADGSTVVGWVYAPSGNQRPARWVLGVGIELLGPGQSSLFPRALGASADGQRIYGIGGGAPLTDHGFRWDAPGPIQSLQVLPGYASSRPNGISSTGHFIAGNLSGSGTPDRAAIWNHAGVGMLLPLPTGANSSHAWTVSGNTTVVGAAYTAQGQMGVRWRPMEGTVEYISSDPLPAEHWVRSAVASADAAVLAGFVQLPGAPVAFRPWRWTSEGGSVLLPCLPDLSWGYVRAMSADGSVMVGENENLGGPPSAVATVWLADGSVRSLSDYLLDAGVDTAGWRFDRATGISADGRTIVGVGVSPQGLGGGFVAVIPAPGAGVFALAGVLAAARRRRQ